MIHVAHYHFLDRPSLRLIIGSDAVGDAGFACGWLVGFDRQKRGRNVVAKPVPSGQNGCREEAANHCCREEDAEADAGIDDDCFQAALRSGFSAKMLETDFTSPMLEFDVGSTSAKYPAFLSKSLQFFITNRINAL